MVFEEYFTVIKGQNAEFWHIMPRYGKTSSYRFISYLRALCNELDIEDKDSKVEVRCGEVVFFDEAIMNAALREVGKLLEENQLQNPPLERSFCRRGGYCS